MPIEYLSTADIAAWFGVGAATVTKWRGRYPDFPEPDAMTGTVAGWLPDREEEIRAWRASLPGQGARTDRASVAP
jgi:transposase